MSFGRFCIYLAALAAGVYLVIWNLLAEPSQPGSPWALAITVRNAATIVIIVMCILCGYLAGKLENRTTTGSRSSSQIDPAGSKHWPQSPPQFKQLKKLKKSNPDADGPAGE